MSFLGSSNDNDELTTYMDYMVRNSEQEMLISTDGIVYYWLSKQRGFPILSNIALRVLAVPGSSAASERYFSLLKLSVGKKRCNSKDDTMITRLFYTQSLREDLKVKFKNMY